MLPRDRGGNGGKRQGRCRDGKARGTWAESERQGSLRPPSTMSALISHHAAAMISRTTKGKAGLQYRFLLNDAAARVVTGAVPNGNVPDQIQRHGQANSSSNRLARAGVVADGIEKIGHSDSSDSSRNWRFATWSRYNGGGRVISRDRLSRGTN